MGAVMVSTPTRNGASQRQEHTAMQILQFKVVTLIDDKEEINKFNDTIDNYLENHQVMPLVQGLKKIIKLPARLQLFDDVRRIVPLRQQMEYNILVPYTSNRTRNVELQRRAPTYDFGFSIRGGREHGTGFFVSHIEPNSEAFFQGLKIGDQIVRTNGFSVEYAIHREVLQLIQSTNHLYLKVRSVGMIPVKDGHYDMSDEDLSLLLRYQRPERVSLPANIGSSTRRSGIETTRNVPPNIGKTGRSVSLISVNKKHDSLTWKMVEEQRSVSPPFQNGRALTRAYSEGSMLEKHLDETRDIKLYLDLSDHSSLGVSICKGTKQRPGIFIQSTREQSLASEAGFLAGDQIIECNGTNFEDIEFNEAVKILKENKQLDLVIRRGVAGLELFGESSGYNSSSSSVNGDHHADGGKRLSLITEDPEDGERSRSNSRRGPDETLAAVMEHPADTVDSKETLVQVQIHQQEEEERMNPLTQSSSGSSLSSFSSAVSLEARRRAERREDDDSISLSSQDRRRQREIAITALPAERRQKHAQQLMQEFQQVHSKMFSSTVNGNTEFSSHQDRVASAKKLTKKNEATAALISRQEHNEMRRSSDAVEMRSLDTLTLSSPDNNAQKKPPAVYFGGKAGKSTPGVVTITEYPTDRRPNPTKFDFLGHSNGHNGTHHHEDTQGALSSELYSTLSRSNLRQLSEPMPTPPPPPLSPQLQDNYEPPSRASTSPEPVRIDMNGDSHRANQPSQMRMARSKVSAIQALARAKSPPPVIARKPIAIPYSELVNQSNQVLVEEPLRIQNHNDDMHSNSRLNNLAQTHNWRTDQR